MEYLFGSSRGRLAKQGFADADINSLFGKTNSLFRRKFSLFDRVGNSIEKASCYGCLAWHIWANDAPN
jgi:hypothetical protein